MSRTRRAACGCAPMRCGPSCARKRANAGSGGSRKRAPDTWLAFVLGRRTHATFRRLQAVLAAAGWRVKRWLTDAWGVYEACLPAAQRQAGKAPLQRLERKHLTLRTRLKRLTRKTSCFSKKQFFHDGLITLFIFHFFFWLSIKLTHDRPFLLAAWSLRYRTGSPSYNSPSTCRQASSTAGASSRALSFA